MNDSKNGPDEPGPATPEAASEVRLDPRLQNRNVLIYASLVSLIFLSAPTLYVGFVQATLCKRLHTSDTLANLPSTVNLSMMWFPVIVAWLVPQARLLKASMSAAYGVMALMCAVVAAVLLVQAPREVIIGALIAHAALLGCANGVVLTHGWEMLGRGVSERLRGKAFGLAFGVGACFAVVGSLGAQFSLEGRLFGLRAPPWLAVAYPYSYSILFSSSAFLMTLAAILVHFFRLPLPKTDVERESFSVAVLGGFKSVLGHRILLLTCIGYLLVYCGNMVQNNMSIFTREAVGKSPEELVGYQLALRFSFKMMAGAFLGWLLARTNPKVPLLVTIGFLIMGVLWVLLVPGYWFLLAFGLNGAGELFGVYFVNYAVSCSPKSQVRRNLAFLFLTSTVVSVSPVFYGWISDTWSLRTSFWTALVILAFTITLMILKLPSRPRPRAQDLTAADLAEEFQG